MVVSHVGVDVGVVSRLEGLGFRVRTYVLSGVFSSVGLDWGVLCGIPVELVEWADYIIVPGSSRLGGEPCWFRDKVVRGPLSLYALPDFLSRVDPGSLSLSASAEDVVGPVLWDIVEGVLGRVRGRGRAWCSGCLCPALRPPPFTIVGEVYGGLDDALRMYSSGVDVVVFSLMDRDRLRLVEEAVDRGLCAGVDSWRVEDLIAGLEAGGVLGMSLTHDKLHLVPSRLRDEKAFVIVPRSLGDWRSRVEELENAYKKAVELGYTKIVLDPVLQPPVYPGMMDGLIASRMLSERIDVPILLGINNVYEMTDADSEGVIALLVALAYEAGSSLILVSEESHKSLGSPLEARLAVEMVSLSHEWKTPPKNLGISLLIHKQKRGLPTS